MAATATRRPDVRPFFGSDRGGETAAVVMSVLASAKRHGIEPVA
jgi:hypothetical protein